MDTKIEHKSINLLHILLCDINICLNLKYVKKIFLLPELEEMPKSPDYVVGLCNIAGQATPVIDLRKRLSLPRDKPYDLNTPVVLCCANNQEVGVIVDEVINLTELREENMQMRKKFDQTDSPFIASFTLGNQLALLLNVDHILTINLIEKTSILNIDKTLLQMAKRR